MDSQVFVPSHKNNIPQITPFIKECEIRFVLVVKTLSVNNIYIYIYIYIFIYIYIYIYIDIDIDM